MTVRYSGLELLEDELPDLMLFVLFWPETLFVVVPLLCKDEPVEPVSERLAPVEVEFVEYPDFLEGPILL